MLFFYGDFVRFDDLRIGFFEDFVRRNGVMLMERNCFWKGSIFW